MLYMSLEFTTIIIMIWLTVHQCCMCHLSLLRSSSWSGWLFTNVGCVTWVYYDHHHDLVDCSPMLYVSLEFITIIIMIWLTVHQCCMCHLSLPLLNSQPDHDDDRSKLKWHIQHWCTVNQIMMMIVVNSSDTYNIGEQSTRSWWWS
jgi:hypothetical protein